jgi:hypothetical protein
MRIDASGNVGIGTSSPSQKLDIGGGGNLRLSGASTGDQSIRVGTSRSGNGYSFIDLQGDTTYDNGLRIIRTNGGANTPSHIEHRGTGALSLITQEAGPITFLTSATERARIDSTGKFQVGTTSSAYSGANAISEAEGGSFAASLLSNTGGISYATLYVFNKSTSGDNELVQFGTEGTWTGRGSITYNRVAGLVAYNTTSDYRAKDIIGPVQNPGATIDALKVYEGVMKGAAQSRPMLVAHEAQEVTPYAVTGEKDAVNEDATDKHQQIDHSTLIPLLIAEIQSLRARVAQLEGN